MDVTKDTQNATMTGMIGLTSTPDMGKRIVFSFEEIKL
jgi:hypothetical protein